MNDNPKSSSRERRTPLLDVIIKQQSNISIVLKMIDGEDRRDRHTDTHASLNFLSELAEPFMILGTPGTPYWYNVIFAHRRNRYDIHF